jgi:hypothetical protein
MLENPAMALKIRSGFKREYKIFMGETHKLRKVAIARMR